MKEGNPLSFKKKSEKESTQLKTMRKVFLSVWIELATNKWVVDLLLYLDGNGRFEFLPSEETDFLTLGHER